MIITYLEKLVVRTYDMIANEPVICAGKSFGERTNLMKKYPSRKHQ